MSGHPNRLLYAGLGVLGTLAISAMIFAWAGSDRAVTTRSADAVLPAEVAIRHAAFELDNRGPDDWTVLEFELTASATGEGPRYRATASRLNAGQQLTIPLREFVTAEGLRFDAYDLKPAAVQIRLHVLGQGDVQRVFSVR